MDGARVSPTCTITFALVYPSCRNFQGSGPQILMRMARAKKTDLQLCIGARSSTLAGALTCCARLLRVGWCTPAAGTARIVSLSVEGEPEAALDKGDPGAPPPPLLGYRLPYDGGGGGGSCWMRLGNGLCAALTLWCEPRFGPRWEPSAIGVSSSPALSTVCKEHFHGSAHAWQV